MTQRAYTLFQVRKLKHAYTLEIKQWQNFVQKHGNLLDMTSWQEGTYGNKVSTDTAVKWFKKLYICIPCMQASAAPIELLSSMFLYR
jgi:hypothetical protein